MPLNSSFGLSVTVISATTTDDVTTVLLFFATEVAETVYFPAVAPSFALNVIEQILPLNCIGDDNGTDTAILALSGFIEDKAKLSFIA